ncbi:MAG: aminotransferase class I/II-fold pyridoxal phosphate-dependent enzyme [Christensenellales bacterium]|jgi:cystathionine beta-lyase family protein involved in aluminum resistance
MLKDLYNSDSRIYRLINDAEKRAEEGFLSIDEIEMHNQIKVLDAFQKNSVSSRHFMPSTGYGYGDESRDMLERVFADALGFDDALVRPHITCGTHALSVCLFAMLDPGDTALFLGRPYDTLDDTIKGGYGSLESYGIKSEILPLKDGLPDIEAALVRLKSDADIKLVYMQRSRGYEWRHALKATYINEAAARLKSLRPDIRIMVDNCYGEFTEKDEPYLADGIAGSLIKNIGGGIAPTGGYIAGSAEIVERAAKTLNTPGLGRETGSYAALYTPYYQGLFLAPHVVAQSLKGAALFAAIFELLGYDTLPRANDTRSDIIQAVRFGDEELLKAFCRGVQKASPIDSMAVPEPWDMPGYRHKVIMAAGAFIQGSSIELSADAPIRPPYAAYIQGGLTYSHVKAAAAITLDYMMRGGYLTI